MKETYIKITVSGPPKTGKTTLAELIGDALMEHGFDVSMETDADGQPTPREAIAAVLKSNIRVMVQERDVASVKSKTWKHRPKNAAVAAPPPIVDDEFPGTDQTIACIGCGADFIFTVGEQEFFASRKLNKTPKRCKACLGVKKSQHSHHAA